MGYSYGQASQNVEEIDVATVISPVLLKAYNVLKQCELRPEVLDQIEEKLKQKLHHLKKCQKDFESKMK